jgi:hypothetical protein
VSAFWQSPVVILALMSWLSAPPMNLGEAAQREALRRRLIPKSRTLLTNAGQPPEVPLTAAAPALEAPPDGSTAAAPAGAPARDEKWWRSRIANAREVLARDQAAAENMQTRINVLQRDVVNVDNPVRQAQLRDELKKTLEELNRSKQLVIDDTKAIEDIQTEARKANVPAGWVR